jgi:hypothetical protein
MREPRIEEGVMTASAMSVARRRTGQRVELARVFDRERAACGGLSVGSASAPL